MARMKALFLTASLLSAGTSACADENGEAAPLSPSSTPSMSSTAENAPASPLTTQTPTKPEIVTQLEALVEGLQMPSETDAPFRVFFVAESPDEPKAADFARMANIEVKDGEALETRSLGDLLDGPAQEEDWMREEEKATARRFAALRAFLNANFAEIEVFAWGDAKKQIVVAGRVEGGFAGLVTIVVET